MKVKTTNTEITAWLGAGALTGLLLVGAPFAAAQAQDTSATRQDTSTVRHDTSTRAAAADSGDTSSAADATTRTKQRERQDTMSSPDQNPPGYRGMERPVGTDSARAQPSDTGAADTASADTTLRAGQDSSRATSDSLKTDTTGAVRSE